MAKAQKIIVADDGAHYDMPFEDYLRVPAISQSGLKKIMVSGHYFRYAEDSDSSAKSLGRIAHCAVLEPDQMKKRFRVLDVPRRGTKKWKLYEKNASQHGAELIKPADSIEAHELAKRVRSHPEAADLLQDIRAEVSLIWTDPVTGETCKARLDGYDEKRGIIVELKTIRDLKPDTISREVDNQGYHVQQAFYTDGARACGLRVMKYRFIFVSKADGDVAVVNLAMNAVDLGREMYETALIQYSDYQKRDYWPGVCPQGELEVDLPAWSYQRLEANEL